MRTASSMRSHQQRQVRPARRLAVAAGLCLASAAAVSPAPVAADPGLPVADCPASMPEGTTCYSGQQESGAYYWIAVPEDWNGTLVVHAHGGPDLGEASPERSRDDLDRWAVMVSEGNAWAGSSYRRGGYGTQMAAADTEQVRRLFVDAFGEPDTTLLHGQSWGGNVAAKALELYGQKNRDGTTARC